LSEQIRSDSDDDDSDENEDETQATDLTPSQDEDELQQHLQHQPRMTTDVRSV